MSLSDENWPRLKNEADTPESHLNNSDKNQDPWRINVIFYKKKDGSEHFAVCDFLSNDEIGDNTKKIDDIVLAARDKETGLITEEFMLQMIAQYQESLPQEFKEKHKDHKTIIVRSEDGDADYIINTLSKLMGKDEDGRENALQLLSDNGLNLIYEDDETLNNDDGPQ